MELMEHQKKAVQELSTGKVLHGGVGTGKSLTGMAYYMENHSDKDLYIITTAKKRNDLDWMREGARFGVGMTPETTVAGVMTIDSWNSIPKYIDVTNAFFILDEQRLVGYGAWVKAFLKIAKNNDWIMLSGTPGDIWMDYAPLFIANGYFKNITEFRDQHVIFKPFSPYPVVQGYKNEARLHRLRNYVLVAMPFLKHTVPHVVEVPVSFDEVMVKDIIKKRWDPYLDEPIKDSGQLFRVIRRQTNEHPSRVEKIRELLVKHDRLIIFYNFNYELAALRELSDVITVAEYNGKKKQPIPETDKWVYLVQYVAGAEGWNCTSTDAMAFYSMTYSYKNFEQAQGRTDRLDTGYTDLYYYVLKSKSWSDISIMRSIDAKRNFNERDIAGVEF